MMLELSPDASFGVLSPAFCGCEQGLAVEECAGSGCNFYKEGFCELFGTGFEPLECRFCHHGRTGQGQVCHAALERDWNSERGRALAARWMREFWSKKI